MDNIWANLNDFNSINGFQRSLASPNVGMGRIWHVDTINGSDTNSGKFAGLGAAFATGKAFATVAKAFTMINQYDTVIISGVVKEQVVAPVGVFDINIIGGANRPRQATSSGVPTGGGACWISPANPAATTALLEVINQGWRIENIFFAPVTNSPAIQGTRAEDAVHPDPSHMIIRGCYFQGGGTGQIGFQDSGGLYNILIENCEFDTLGGVAIKGIAGAGIATPLKYRVVGNRFEGNTNDIIIGSSYGYWARNSFIKTTTKRVNLTAGDYSRVVDNQFGDASASVSIAGGYTKSGTNDYWRNWATDAADPIVAVPA